MHYPGEHTFIGIFGHFFIIIAFVSALIGGISYFLSERNPFPIQKESLRKQGGTWFMVHSGALILVVLTLFYMIASHFFEYNYVWKYSNRAMEWKYIFSCFWSGQEGSFLLWSFWAMIAGWVIMKTSSSWEAPVMTIVSIFQVFVFSMLLGVYLGDFKIGSSPFMLIRQLPENAIMPWTQMPDYLFQIEEFQDGLGLNPLLQNYWMTIHPPTLFLGFALCLIPFAFAIAGYWRHDTNGWIKPALPWAFVAVATLAAGILMGGAWAYESLSFGGFWAWDPVENASLVPWLIIIGAAHCMLIARARKKANFMSAFLAMMAFILVIYSSFLTRSGVLGESSVHSFTDNGMMGQLLFMLFFFFALMIIVMLQTKRYRAYFLVFSSIMWILMLMAGQLQYTLLIYLSGAVFFLIVAHRQTQESEADELASSREFWMFMGVLVICISALQITVTTSIPVINKIFGTRYDAFTNLDIRNQFYKVWQLPFAVAVTFLLALSQYLKYRETPIQWLKKKLLLPLLVSGVFAFILAWLLGFSFTPAGDWLLLFTVIFAVTANIEYFNFRKLSQNGASVAHLGFAFLIGGALVSMTQSEPISQNNSGVDVSLLNKEFKNNENIVLKKGDTTQMGRYFVSYTGKHQEGVNIYYHVDYLEDRKGQAGNVLFTLKPFVQLNERFGNVAEPGTKRFLTHDIFTHVKWADLEVINSGEGQDDDFMGLSRFEMTRGETYRHENMVMRLEYIQLAAKGEGPANLELKEDDIVIKATLSVMQSTDTNRVHVVEPFYVVRDSSEIIPSVVYDPDLETEFSILQLSSKPETLVMGLQEREYMVLSATIFPWINILWIGCVLLVLGSFMAAIQGFGKWLKNSGRKHLHEKGDNGDGLAASLESEKDAAVEESSTL
ncbi:MAG: cytochrome c biogenesis protein CcsA [Cyclobacteriaceae bacterium]|nr:cytochrome c biogenesis protein CcsA [Cyclobacteriaceae bacterium]